MTSRTIPSSKTKQEAFETQQVLPIIGAHFVHDTFTGFVPTLLPLLIDKLTLTLTQAGWLTTALQLPAVLNPFIGYLADRVSLRYFVILAPGITATLISSLGLASNFYSLMLLLFLTGVSVACFHAPAPAMIGRLSGKQVGYGMSLFMAAGELGRTVGPILAATAVSLWTLQGIYRMMLIGWVATIILYLRMRHVSAHTQKPGNLRFLVPLLPRLFLPIAVMSFFRLFMIVSLTTYLPTYMSLQGSTLWLASGALTILELAGVAGALVSGTISDKLGRKKILLVAIISSTIFMLFFLNLSDWFRLVILLFLGFSALSIGPVLLAMVQEQLPNNRAVGNGIFMVINFSLRSVVSLLLGVLGDRLGLQITFTFSALISLVAIPAVLLLPNKPAEATYSQEMTHTSSN